MTAYLIGYEGRRPTEDQAVTWGAGAVRVGDRLLNSVTGLAHPFSQAEVDAMGDNGSLALLPTPLRLSYSDDSVPALDVIEVATDAVWEPEFVWRAAGRERPETKQRLSGSILAVFDKAELFGRFRRALLNSVLQKIGYSTAVEPVIVERLFEAGFTLDAHDPVLNAMDVVLNGSDLEVAKVLMRTEGDQGRLKQCVEGLQSQSDQYAIRYKDGVAAGGGMDMSAIERMARAFTKLTGQVNDHLAKSFPFLDFPDSPRLWQLQPSSANFEFTARLDERPLGDRMARHLQLVYLQRLIELGELGDADEKELPPFVRSEVHLITRPSAETTALHRRIGETEFSVMEDVADLEDDEKWSEKLVLLGYQSGILREGQHIEASVFPGLVLRMSSTDNGRGGEPGGLAFLRRNRDFLFRPALYSVVRRVRRGAAKYFLQSVQVLREGEMGHVTAFPSSVVKGGLVVRRRLEAERVTHERLALGGLGELTAVAGTALPLAQKWMHEYASLCYAEELRSLRAPRLAPARGRRHSTLVQVLVALEQLGWEAHQGELVDAVERLFSKVQRQNNLRREVIRHPELLRFRGKKNISATKQGERYLAAHRAAWEAPLG